MPQSHSRNSISDFRSCIQAAIFSISFLVHFLLFPHQASAQDYVIKAVPPNFVRDSSTTFLVDLSSAKTNADYAAGNSGITVSPAGFLSSGAYQGTVGFTTAQNLNPASWTIELMLYLPYSSATNSVISLGSWQSGYATQTWSINTGFGAEFRSITNRPDSYFFISPYSGGNGRSIQASAPDKWVHLIFGVDYNNRKSHVLARDTAGNLLNNDINFLGGDGVNTSFLSAYPVDQQAAELARRWSVLAADMISNAPTSITLGSSLVQLRAIKISNTFRSDLLDISPQQPTSGATVWTPSSLDPSRTVSATVTRTVGYPGYNNFISMNVNEAKLVLTPGSTPITINLPTLPIGLYSFMVYGTVDPKGRNALNRVWLPTPMQFSAVDATGKNLGRGKMLLKQSFIPRRMQGFHFHVDSPSTVTATFQIPAEAQETVWLQYISLVDQLAGLPDAAVKTAQNLATGPATQLNAITTTRRNRDDAIWAALPPLNQHLQVHAQVAQFKDPPTGVTVDNWVLKAYNNIPIYYTPQYTFNPVEFLNLSSGAIFSTASIYNNTPWPGTPSDDGNGLFFSKNSYPSLTTDIYNAKRAELLGSQYLLFAGAIMNTRGSSYGANLGTQYFTSGDPEVGHDGAMALVRWAYDWPALEMSLHEFRLNTHSPDFEFNTDWSDPTRRNGKMYYEGWSGSSANWLMETYDQLFPYIKNNQLFADEVHRFIPWVNTPQDVIRFLDRYLVFSSVRDVKRGLIGGDANVQANAAAVLGPSSLTQNLYDLTQEPSNIYPYAGTYQELYATALSRSGVYYIASFLTYAFGDAQNTIHKAFLQKKAREAGVSLKMDLSDVARYAKVRSAGEFLLNMWVAGGFPFMVGDASGGPHSSIEAPRRITASADAFKEAFNLYSDPKLAWVLKNMLGVTDSAVVQAALGQTDPVTYAQSRVIPDYGAVIEANENESDLRKKTAMTLRLGIGQGHSHHDYLDLNIFGMGLPLAVDLACRSEGNNWSRPSASWSFLHNHALAHNTVDPNGAGSQTGEPWLRAFSPPLLQASYVDDVGSTRLDRDTSLIQVGNSGNYYAVDIQRISGKALHTWAFHGAESNSLALNVPMTAQTVRWIDRTLEGTHFTGTAIDKLQATWTMTRSGSSYPFTFNGGGTIQTVGAEPTALGNLYDGNLPPVNVRATLLGQAGAAVLQGNPYSLSYAYSFPFLWVQKPATGTSIFPAIYEWYRGTTPVTQNAEVLSWSPLTMRVTLGNGQIDTIESRDDGAISIVSKDSQGVLWSKFVGIANASLAGVSVTMGTNYQALITDINYQTHTLTTNVALPANSYVIAGNSGRKIYLKLKGSGTTFNWDDDLLVHEGNITDLHTLSANTIQISTNQPVFAGGFGNRKTESLTLTNEDGSWHFRNNTVIKKPTNANLSNAVFSDANGDGFINAKTYEIGVGDTLQVPVETTIRRNGTSYQIKTNSNGSGKIGALQYSVTAAPDWQTPRFVQAPMAPSNLSIVR